MLWARLAKAGARRGRGAFCAARVAKAGGAAYAGCIVGSAAGRGAGAIAAMAREVCWVCGGTDIGDAKSNAKVLYIYECANLGAIHFGHER